MPYIPGEHWVRCAQCQKRIYSSLAIKDRIGLYVCKEHTDPRQIGIDFPRYPLRQDPAALDARNIQIEGVDVFFSRGNWEDIDKKWEAVDTNWEAT